MKKILIANRGEIAARIIRTCKKMGIQTVAIYSDADKTAPFVRFADESYHIGASHVNESYLNVDKILQIAEEAHVDAVHPGYGFMSENSLFAKKCAAKNIKFIGPTPEVLEQMGDKIIARNMMEQAGVPVVPGTKEEVVSVKDAVTIAEDIGYPIMLKASAGGGGIGMQLVENEAELTAAFDNNAKRAASFFGNGAMYLEKFIPEARHIEIQLLADEHGNVLHLFERECSIQRRNQKVIEEARAVHLSEATRLKMAETAVHAAKEIAYTNAGTIEFLVDANENFYFLEMNTRIQVEHPVTEEITGIDLIAEQIKVAQGNTFSLQQADIAADNHAIEARIYAEDPVRFFPSPGKITKYVEPEGEYIRIESAVEENSDVTPFYDPMIAKVIVTAETRDKAITELILALENYKIEGIKTNIPMIIKVLKQEAFQQGNITIHYVQEHLS